MANGKATIRLYFSDLIGEVYKGWHDTKLILDVELEQEKPIFV